MLLINISVSTLDCVIPVTPEKNKRGNEKQMPLRFHVCLIKFIDLHPDRFSHMGSVFLNCLGYYFAPGGFILMMWSTVFKASSWSENKVQWNSETRLEKKRAYHRTQTHQTAPCGARRGAISELHSKHRHLFSKPSTHSPVEQIKKRKRFTAAWWGKKKNWVVKGIASFKKQEFWQRKKIQIISSLNMWLFQISEDRKRLEFHLPSFF